MEQKLPGAEAGGVEVVTGVCAEACSRLIDGFACLVRHGRPFVVLKLAAMRKTLFCPVKQFKTFVFLLATHYS